jgi:L-fucose mutarotase
VLKTRLLHPEILSALATAGHGSRVLIADGNYPFVTGSSPSARRVYLNLAPGIVSSTDVLRSLLEIIPIEAAAVMLPESGEEPAIFDEFRRLVPEEVALESLGRADFYKAVRDQNTALVIATGEQRTFANILLTIGVVKPCATA